MTLTVNKKAFTGNLTATTLNEIITLIKASPQPTVVPLDEANVKEEETVLCLQREAAYVDLLNPTNVRYLGSKNVIDCILVYLYNETDHLVIHVDTTTNFNLLTLLNNFRSKENIEVILAGGSLNSQSKTTLENIIKALFDVSNQLKINITIKSQKIIEANKFSQEGKYEFMYSKILDRADILSRRYFGKPLNLDAFKARKVSDLKTRTVPLDPLLQAAITMLSNVRELPKQNIPASVAVFQNLFNTHIKTEQDFIDIINKVFSKEGFKCLDFTYTLLKLYQHTQLNNFVFELNSGKVFSINPLISTPNEDTRDVAVLDAFREPQYFLCYDGKKGEYFTPALSKRFIDNCLSAKPLVAKDSASEAEITSLTQKFNIPNQIILLNCLIKFIKSPAIQQLNQNANISTSSITHFKPAKQLDASYESEEIKSTNLSILNKITHLNFTAKLRRYPQHTLDALLTCTSEAHAEIVKELVESFGITAKVLKSAENSFYVCVPAINVREYAEPIAKASAQLRL